MPATTHDAAARPRAIALLILFVIAGGVLVYFVWEEINELLAGTVIARHVLVGVVLLVMLLILLRALGQFVRRLDRPADDRPTSPSASGGTR